MYTGWQVALWTELFCKAVTHTQRKRGRNLSWDVWYCIRSFFSLSQHRLVALLYWHTVKYSNTDSIYFRIFVHIIKLRVSPLISLYFGKHEWFLGCSVCFGLNVRVEYYDGYSSPLSRLAMVASTLPADCAPGTHEPHQRPTFQVGLSTVWWNNCVLSHQIHWTWGSSLHGEFLNSTCKAETLQLPRNWSYFRLNLNLDADRNPYRADTRQFSWERFQLKYN